MASASDSTLASTARPVPLLKRADLVIRRQRYQGMIYYVIKNPVTLKYFRLKFQEYAILQMLDGRTSLEQMRVQFALRFAPDRVLLSDLQRCLGMFHRCCIVVSTLPGQAVPLEQRRIKLRRQRWRSRLANPLSIRLWRFDPAALLMWLSPLGKLLFTRPAVVFWGLAALAAAVSILVRFDAFVARLPALHEFIGLGNWSWLLVVLAMTTAMHELGHGLACRHFRGECHEMGVMLLAFTPCLYCNVSDTWLLPSKWRRAAIGAAGMYVDMILATLATGVWWLTEPGLVNQMALAVMLFRAISAIPINANPLVRYDGYYILSDLVEIPNLAQRARELLKRWSMQALLGLESAAVAYVPRRVELLLAAYGVAAAVYRWTMLLAVLVFLYSIYRPLGIPFLGPALGLATIWGIIVSPLWSWAKFMHQPGRMDEIRPSRLKPLLAIVAVVLVAAATIPLPWRIRADAKIHPSQAAAVFVQRPARLLAVLARPGERVAAGAPLARFRPLPELAQPSTTATSAATPQPDFEIVAPRDGIVLPPPDSATESIRQRADSPPFLLDEAYLGATASAGQWLCQVADTERMVVELPIEESQFSAALTGRPVALRLQAFPWITLHAAIEDVRPLPAAARAQWSSVAAAAVVRGKEQGIAAEAAVVYVARAQLDNPDGIARGGMRGSARIQADWQPLLVRGWQALAGLFR